MAALKSFTIHSAPEQAGRDPDGALRFVPDSFSVVAFVAPWAYFLWHRMWLVTLAYVVAVAILIAALLFAGFAMPVRVGIAFVFNLLIGLEATNLRRWTLGRRGFRDEGVVVASTRDEAERRYFSERASALAPPPATLGGPPSVFAAPSAPAGDHVIGLFPEAESRPRGTR
ncbi:DUF2628 domain-containing protein [Phreatobacter stygius]|uniref:DUF2628 domain-containing protein n=1 Tax=Phreatobacter stygius TaxID=1940610 RepID=A0A4D7B1U5_9HYPH|nr:DUF2628 domain-containing protein [Phreatobacter stygius]QCI64963.1 DUF2628 domain-containing protein [Phreatobacter stygius]